ncbi:DUF6571 family protein [Streptomyces sp. NBC_01262]|uniref:DUF6571 family protein n=1 Tax=Streptomyces sp. NBC_01262 TaxID=2903803 RepID=UPI002E32B1BB|nr:DUF6571 family protein [Streptomyces sp. NBC_01262]
MPSYIYLKEADLSSLDAAAGSWQALTAKYEGLGDEFSRRVTKHLQGHWEGDAADSAFATMTKAEQQYKDAATEAGRIGKLLADAHTEFARYQKALNKLVDEATSDNYSISDQGVIEDVDPRMDSQTASGTPGLAEERTDKLHSLKSRMKEILLQATAADEAASAALQRDANGKSDGFNTSVYTTLDAVEADEASQLMKKKGRLTDAEVTKLNNLLAANKNDPEFSRRFAVETGADNMLSKYNQLINPPAGTTLSKSELAELKQLQKNLGTTIGTATTSDDKNPDPDITRFQNDLLDAGQQEFNANPTESSSGLNGYQLTSSLMSNGKWDTAFLQDYGDNLIAAEANGANAGQNPDTYWSGSGTRALGSTNLGALDPMTGFMDALGHNPEASTEFLTSDSTANGEKVDHLDYLLKDRHWPEGGGYTGDSSNPSGYNNLGHAIESATTGHAHGTAPSANTPAHTEQQAALVNRLVEAVSIDPDLAHDGMQDSLGKMTAEYMPDVYRGLNGDGKTESDFLPLGDSATAGLKDPHLSRFLYTVGQDPDGYAAISYGQAQYSSDLINYHFAHPDAYGLSNEETLEKIANRSGEVEGIMALGRRDSDVQESAAGDKAFNDALSTGGEYAKGLTALGIGVGTAAITSPAGGAIAGVAAEGVSGYVIDQMVSGMERDSSGRALVATGTDTVQSREAVSAQLRDAAQQADDQNSSGMNAAKREEAVNRGAEDGYGYAHDHVDDYSRAWTGGAE